MGDPTRVWGSAKAVEFVVCWPGPAQLHPSTGRCPTCAEPVWAAACAFCRAQVVPGAPVPIAAQPADAPPVMVTASRPTFSTAGGATP